MLHPRFWSPRARFWGLAAVFTVVPASAGALSVLGESQDAWDQTVAAAPVAAATAALLTLGLTAVTATSNWQRAKKVSTIDAWVKWSSESLPLRETVTRLLGTEKLKPEQGKALIERTPVEGLAGPLTEDEADELAKAIRGVLNGLERIAVGVELGVFDLNTLRRLGGTTILYCYQRWEQYVLHRRNAEDERVRFERAFVDLEVLANRLQAHDLLTRKQVVDQEYVRARLQNGR